MLGVNQETLESLIFEKLESHPKFNETMQSLNQNAEQTKAKEQILKQPVGTTFKAPDGKYYTRVDYGKGIRQAKNDEIRRLNG